MAVVYQPLICNLYLLILLLSSIFYDCVRLHFLYVHIKALCSPCPPKIIFITASVWFFGKPKVSLIYLSWSCVTKYCTTRPFVHIFCVLLLPPVPKSPMPPIRMHNCPYAPTRTTLCLHHMNMNFWGNFPAIRPKSM